MRKPLAHTSFSPADRFAGGFKLCSFGGGGGGGGTTNTVAEPFAEQKPFLVDLFKRAEANYQNNQPQFFPDRTFAPRNPDEAAAIGQLRTGAGQVGRLADTASGGADFLVSPEAAAGAYSLAPQADLSAFNLRPEQLQYLSPDTNPHLAQAAQGAVRPIYQNLTEQALPAVRSGAGVAGQTGSSRQALAEAIAISRANQTAGDVTSRIYSDAYQNALNNFIQQNTAAGQAAIGAGTERGGDILQSVARGLAVAPNAAQLYSTGAGLQGAAGQATRGFDQASIDEAIARHNFAQTAETARLTDFANLIRGNYGGTTTASSQGAGGFNPLASGLGGAALGASIGSLTAPASATGLAALGGPWWLAGGAALGLLSGLFD